MKKANFIIITLFCSLFLAVTSGNAKKLAEFKDFFRDPFLIMDSEHYYVWDRSLLKVYIYSKTNLKKIAEFGNRGEGPGEFIGISRVSVDDDYLYISSFPKLCFFNKKGKLKKEIKGPTDAGSFIPVGNMFIGKSYPFTDPYSKESLIQFSLFDSGLKKKKDLFLTKCTKFSWPGERKENALWIKPCVKAVPFEDKAIIGNSGKGFFFAVFDANGTMLYDINKEYKVRPVTEKEKNKIITDVRERMGDKWWNDYKLKFNMVFPEQYPAYHNFAVDNNKIYVFLYPGEKSIEVLVLDMKGVLLQTKEIPLVEQSIMEWGQFNLNNGKFYYVADNLETEIWELHEHSID